MAIYPVPDPLDPSKIDAETLKDWETRLDVSKNGLVGEKAAIEWIKLFTAYQNVKFYQSQPPVITVPPAQPPTVQVGNDISVTDTNNNGNEVVELVGSASTVESIVSRTWTSLPENTIIGTSDRVNVTVAAGTTKTFKYTAISSTGASASDEVRVTVAAAPVVPPPTPSAGWTELPDATARKIYVDKTGNDTTGDGSSTKPYLTLTKVKSVAVAGNVIVVGPGSWEETSWTLSGASPTKPTVIMGWPGKDRPTFQGNTGAGFAIKAGTVINNFWLLDIVFKHNNGSGKYPLDFLCSGSNLRIEGCLITGGTGVRIQPWPNTTVRFNGVTIYRTIIANCADYNGIYLENVDNLVIDSSYIHDNGGVGDIRKQGCYIHQSCGPAVVRNSMFSMNCAGGLQQRPGGTCVDCFGYKNPINFQIGHGETNLSGSDNSRGPYKATGTISNCVAYDSDNVGTSPRGHGFWLANCVNVICDNNIAMNQSTGSYPVGFVLTDGATSATIKNCLVYKWANASEDPIQSNSGTLTQQNNDIRYAKVGSNPGTTYPDPNRTILTLCTSSLGIAASETAFINDMLLQSKSRWKTALEAKNIVSYFKAGFGR